jgi:hypothetical protein
MNIRKDKHGKNCSVDQDEPPPFMGTWNKIYAAIAIYTCVLILVLYLITILLNH